MSESETNLMAGLKKSSKDGKTAIKIESEDLIFDPDDRALAQAMANAMLVHIRDNLSRGLAPNSEPLPALKASTIEWREAEKAQGQRGGNASDRYVDNAFRHQAKNNFERDYTAPKLGHFKPETGGPRGVVSGMLLKSFAARPSRDGKSVMIYVAAKRGKPRPSTTSGRKPESKSALESVFADVPVWDNRAWNTPVMKSAMQEAAKSLLGKKVNMRALHKLASKLVGELGSTLETAQSLAED
jgi:hypothetical protein